METRTVDPRLEADLADLLTQEARPHWLSRASAVVAIPAAVVLLAALAAVPLLRPAPTQVVLAQPQPAAPVVSAEPTELATASAPMPTPSPSPVVVPSVPPATPSAPDWMSEAHGFAAAFAVDYLGWSQFPEATRSTALARYLAPGVDPTAGWRVASQLVAATPIVIATTQESPSRVTVTVAVRITGLEVARWVHLAVPIGRDDTDQLAVVDLPRLVPAPTAGTPADTSAELAPELLELVRTPVEEAVPAQLAAVTTETGFDATQWETVEVSRRPDGTAYARVEVQLTDTVTAAELTQVLWIDLRERDGVWEVTGIR